MLNHLRPLVFFVACVASAWEANAQEVVLKFHHIWPTTAMAPVRVIGPWCEKIAAESKNHLKCQLLPAMSGGGTPAQLVDRVRDGVDDLIVTLPGYTANRFPAMEVFELPFLTSSAEVAASAAWDYLQKNALKEFPGTKILAVWVHDDGYAHTAAKQIKTLDDFKGLKMRAPTRLTNKLLAKLGATPVGMPVPAVADALSKGTIDGFLLPWEVIPGFKLQEMTKYHTETHPSKPSMYSAVFVFAMNQSRYDSLPADLKAVIDRNSGFQLSKQIGKVWDESQEVGRKAAQAHGNTILVLSAAETEVWMKAAAPLREEWIEEVGRRGLNGRQLLQDANDLLAKYKK